MQTKTIFFLDLNKVIEYSASAVIVVSSNPCVGPLLKKKRDIFFLIISMHGRIIVYNKNSSIFIPIEIWKMKNVNKNQIQYHVPNKDIYLDRHF